MSKMVIERKMFAVLFILSVFSSGCFLNAQLYSENSLEKSQNAQFMMKSLSVNSGSKESSSLSLMWNSDINELTVSGEFNGLSEVSLFSDSSCANQVATATKINSETISFQFSSTLSAGKADLYSGYLAKDKSFVCDTQQLTIDIAKSTRDLPFSVESFKANLSDGAPKLVVPTLKSGESIQLMTQSNCTGTQLRVLRSRARFGMIVPASKLNITMAHRLRL